MHFSELETPCALVDLDVLGRNTLHMARRMNELGVRLRPHVKTHKCHEAAALQVREHFGGITVSTLAEAAYFAGRGFRDITYAFPVPIDQLDRIADLRSRVDRLPLLLDHGATLQALEQCASRRGLCFEAFLKVDCGDHRAGVEPGSGQACELAAAMARSLHVELCGILTHAGHSYHCHDRAEIRRVAEQERDVMVDFAEDLRRRGIQVPEVSIGSTPTMSVVEDLEGVSEVRPGNYAFFDAFQAAIGSCRLEDIAFAVLATVVGHYPEQNKLIVNAGALALSKDPGATHVEPECGFGIATSPDGREVHRELRITSLSQEHGQLHGQGPLAFERFPIGSHLRILPNHSCLAAGLFDRYHVIQDGQIVDEWRPVRGW